MTMLRTFVASVLLAPFTLLATPAQASVIYQSSFEGTDGGWLASADWGNGTGDWERGTPAPNPLPSSSNQFLDGPPGAFDGNEVWATLLDNSHTNSGGISFLQQTFDLTGYTSATMHWQQFVWIFYSFDTAELLVNGDLLYERASSASTLDWEAQSVDLTPYAGGLANVSFELDATTVANRPGWYIDSVLIEGELASTHNPIPEPATASLLGLGLAGLALRARRRRGAVA